jgi:uncharacterized protein
VSDILVDTGPLVAIFDPSDRERDSCLQELRRLEGRKLVTSLAVVTEATYLLDFSLQAQQALLTFIADGALEIADFGGSSVGRARELMTKYHDLPMDFADATLVVLAELIGTTAIFSLDRRDFGLYRQRKRKFKLLPKRSNGP